MVNKYQVFISATSEDLKEERKKVQDTILSMSQHPTAMEMFSASNEEPWEIIKQEIDESDFYVLIIGHKYGSVIENGEYAGISYTQREYYYALWEKKIPILAFLIDDSALSIVEKMEQEPVKIEKLKVFKEEIISRHHVEWWMNKDDLAVKVSVALYKQFNDKQGHERTTESYLEKEDLEGKIVSLDQLGKEVNENKQEFQKETIKIDNKNKDLEWIKIIRILFVGIIGITVIIILRGFRGTSWDKEIMLTNEDNVQESQNIEINKVNQEDESVEVNKDNKKKDENMGGELQALEESNKNGEVIDWRWEYEGNADDMRRYLKNTPSELGIDVSKYQGTIDWQKVKADGIDFAIIRVGSRGYKYGNIKLDEKFKENIDGAIANGIKIGVYFYSQAINQDEMEEEISEILKAIEGYRLDYPIVIELVCEGDDFRTYKLSTIEYQKEYIELIQYFCNRIKQKGHIPMIYGTIEWFQQFPTGTFDEYYKWVYSSDLPPNNIENCVVWQYRRGTNRIVDGISDKFSVSINLSAYDGEND